MFQTALEISPYVLSPLALQTIVVALAIFSLGVFAVAKEQGSPVSIAFFMLTLGIGIWLFAFSWMYSSVDERLALWWARVGYAGIAIIPAAAYHFRIYLFQEPASAHRRAKVIWSLSALFAMLAVLTDFMFHSLYRYEWGFYPKAGLGDMPFLAFFFGVMSDSILGYFRVYQRSGKGSVESLRIRYLLITFIVGSAASLDFLASFNIRWYPIGYIAIFFFFVLSADSIRRYQFMAITPSFAAPQIIDTMNDALIVLNPDGIIKVVNKAACMLFGIASQDFVEKRPLEAISACSTFGEKLESIIHLGEAKNTEILCQPREFELKTLSITATIMRNPAGDPLATVCVISDVTEQRRAEEDREKLIVQLQEALANIKRLSGMLPICASCKKIRDDRGYWNQIEKYITEHSEAEFTHGICPACAQKQYSELSRLKERGAADE
ncbi:MAG TPA: histidine kinase N-terminal 7TM domain-containing protein [Nitrospirota bacterium]|nr:histidine kinase N-terminal 7TM domain-containing protein [Nitrospirota bacterium]